ncbi:dynamin family protein [Candidatus Kryptobacter tengchongensis]|uniref:Dynamin family protein n=1 Tax=Kryptobacter tengchongensis TaxID=1643429 RepID=A0A656D107_KRYT1|nr:dynamin family protein [Candidatus Kryptobacter tengchongensis]CUS96537.1 Dynamin family protein [Candidatus Kryptobacter tengchongensis]
MGDLQKLQDLISQAMAVIGDISFLSENQKRLEEILSKISTQELTLPLIGEFSSGKSSLVNSLLGKEVVAVDVLPTTFTVNEIYFSSDADRIEIYSDGKMVERIDELRKVDFKFDSGDILVKIYTTSDILPAGVKIVDLPGLSSTIERHNKVLVDYITKADAVLLVVDSNQATVTLTTKNFLEFTNLFKHEIYLVYTKSDLKSEFERAELFNYAATKMPVKPEKIIFTSAKENYLSEFIELINSINDRKADILFKNAVNDFRNICNVVVEIINNNINLSKLDVKEIEDELKKLNEQIDLLESELRNRINSFEDRLYNLNKETVRNFEERLQRYSGRLATIAFENPDSLENAFDNFVKTSIVEVLDSYSQKLNVEVGALSKEIQGIAESVDIGVTSTIKGRIQWITNIVLVLLVDILAPGGILQAVVYTLIGNFARKIGLLGNIIDRVIEPIKNLVTELVKRLTRSYVETKINEAIKEVVREFENILVNESRNIAERIKSEIYKEFEASKSEILNSIMVLQDQKRKKVDEFNAYLNSLKDKRDRIIEIIKELSF